MDLGHLGEVFEELVSSNISTPNKLVMELAWDELDKDKRTLIACIAHVLTHLSNFCSPTKPKP